MNILFDPRAEDPSIHILVHLQQRLEFVYI